jgi:REP element-mobilizing transposase RayT
MGREQRIQAPDAIYHITSNAVFGAALFRNRWDFETLLRLVEKIQKRTGWIIHGYCLMTTHYHLIVQTPEPNLAEGMQRLNHGYARYYNRRYRRRGALFMARYYSGLIESDTHFLSTFRYITLNPCEAGLCDHPADWPWSSFAGTIGAAPLAPFVTPDTLLAYFGDDRNEARRRLAEFVEAEWDKPRRNIRSAVSPRKRTVSAA